MDVHAIIDHAKQQASDLKKHHGLFEIYEGNLNKHLDKWLEEQIKGDSVRYAKVRKCPVNILRKFVDKLSQIYQSHPTRRVVDGTDTDKALMEYYEDNMRINSVMNLANEFFNMSRATLLQPYAHQGKPRLRAVPNDKFVVYSNDKVDPLNVTHVVLFSDCEVDEYGEKNNIYHVYSNDEFLVVDDKAKVRRDIMNDYGNIDGINPYGAIPFIYTNRSANLLIPPPDLELMTMVILIPGLLTDLNYAAMFSLFSIMYGIDVDDQGMQLAPNAFWAMKSDPSSDKKPEVGTIKNESDIMNTLQLVKTQLALFLTSRSVKITSFGDVEGSDYASGISKMIDESDTSEERQKQSAYFMDTEERLWSLIKNHLHPVWSNSGQIDTRLQFSPKSYVQTQFIKPVPLQNRGQLVRDLTDEIDAGLITKKRAMERLNPEMGEDDINELMDELESENQIEIVSPEVISGTTEDQDQSASPL